LIILLKNIGNEFRPLSKIAGPLIVNNLSIAGMQFADTIMSGMLGAESLAAVAVGSQIWFLGFMVSLGLMTAISPIVARHYGAGDFGKIGQYTQQGLWLAVSLGVFVFLLAQFFVEPLMIFLSFDEEFRDLSIGYVRAVFFGAPAIYAFLVLRFTTEGIGFVRPIMYASLFALVCNVFLNWVFMFGNLGMQAYGVIGCGIASAVTMWLVLLGMTIYVARKSIYRPLNIFGRITLLRVPVIKEIVWLGAPIAGAITAESGFFAAVTLIMGSRGTDITAAHQITVNFVSTLFMIPLALGAATTVRIGHALGAGKAEAARMRGIVGIVLSASFMAASAIFILLFGEQVLGIYTNDRAVIEIGISLLIMAAIFQVADGVQISTAGVLRGYKDTRIPMLINIFSYWALGFPLAYMAIVTYQAPPAYAWAGFVVGLTVAAILLTMRFQSISKTAIQNSTNTVAINVI